MLTTFILLLCMVYIIIYLLLKYTVFNYWEKRNVPFIKPNFFLGNIWKVINLQKTWYQFVYDIQKTYAKERYVGIYKMFQPVLVICDLEIIKNILIKDFDSFQDNWYEIDHEVDPTLSRNPFVLKGGKWKEVRNHLTSQFTTSKIKSMIPLLERVCNNMTKFIESKLITNKSCFELTDLCSRFTGDAVLSCGYSLDAKSFNKEIPDTHYMVDPDFPGSPNKLTKFKRTLGFLFGSFAKLFKITFFGDPVPSRFAELMANTTKDRTINSIVRNDYLNHIMELRENNKIADSDLASFAFVMFLEGFETTFALMCYCLLELSLNPNVQKTAQSEIDRVLQQSDGKMTYETYKKFNYLERVLFESLRKNAVLQVMSKVCNKDYVIQDEHNKEDLVIEKGTLVFWTTKGIHLNSKYYPEPEKFDPDRFTEEAKQTRPKYSFLGFGDGPRICLGRKFAIAQIILATATILSKYDVRFNDKTVLPVKHHPNHIVGVPDAGIYVDLIPRRKEDM